VTGTNAAFEVQRHASLGVTLTSDGASHVAAGRGVLLGRFDPLLDRGLRAVLGEHALHIVGADVDARSLLAAVEELRPSIAIVDEAMTLDLSPFEQLWLTHPSLFVLALVHRPTEATLTRLAEAGVACISKSAPVDQLISALRARASRPSAGDRLTARELDVAKLIRERHLNHREIASELHITIATARTHTASIRRKLGISSIRQLWVDNSLT
jgi:DNA-binding NarL/FixJ family response regulator